MASMSISAFPTLVNTDFFKPGSLAEARSRLGLSHDAIIIVALGRICWVKGWDLILEAASRLAKNGVPKIETIFVGDGEDRERLQQLARSLSLESRVKVTGFVPQELVLDYINAASICVVGSHAEGWSLAMLEMIACGKAVVTTNVSGAGDLVVNDQNGFVVMSRDPDHFASAVERALRIQHPERCSVAIAQRFSTSSLKHRLDQIWPVISGSPVHCPPERRMTRP